MGNENVKFIERQSTNPNKCPAFHKVGFRSFYRKTKIISFYERNTSRNIGKCNL